MDLEFYDGRREKYVVAKGGFDQFEVRVRWRLGFEAILPA